MKVVLILLSLCAVYASPRLDPLVDTRVGLIKGLQASDGDYSMFMGIPYARINESNPFGASEPYPDFEATFEAYDDTAICPQIDPTTNEIIGSLDCLHLNIYVPNKATTRNRLPVLVWIHGGRFLHGFSGRYQYGRKYLVNKDIILITVNYRVGLYGFMCLDIPEVPGNQGLKDQLRALRWVRENIDAFGGDRNKVTIFGESAGGVSVDFHLLSQQEKLFDKAITQSGTALCPWAIVDSDRRVPMEIAARLGFETDDIEEAFNFLRTVEPKTVLSAALEFSILSAPCVEKEFEGVENFITEHPSKRTIPKAKTIPILIGHNMQEMLYKYANKTNDIYEEGVFLENLALAFDSGHDLETLVRQFYIGDENLNEEVKWDLMDFDSDFIFNHPVHRSLSKYLDSDGKVFYYLFSYSGGRNYMKWKENVTAPGATHADEKGYLFDMSMFTETPSEMDQLMIDRMTTMWANFVKYGDPTPATSELLPVEWTPITKDARSYLSIDSELAMKRSPFNKRMAFWDLFYKMNGRLLKGNERSN